MISIKIKDPIFTYCAQLINIINFNPRKISIEKVCAINDEFTINERIYYVKYGGDPFYLVIDDLKVVLSILKNRKEKFIIKYGIG